MLDAADAIATITEALGLAAPKPGLEEEAEAAAEQPPAQPLSPTLTLSPGRASGKAAKASGKAAKASGKAAKASGKASGKAGKASAAAAGESPTGQGASPSAPSKGSAPSAAVPSFAPTPASAQVANCNTETPQVCRVFGVLYSLL